MTATLTAPAHDLVELRKDLEQIGANIPHEAISEWTEDQCETAYVWAHEVYKAANDQMHDPEMVKSAAIPPHVKPWLCTTGQFDPVAMARDTEPDDGQLVKPRRFPVHFGRLSVGAATCRLTIKIATGCLSTQDARELLCERRLDVRIKTGDAQKQFEGMEDDNAGDLEGIGDTRGLSISGGKYGTGLTFNRNDIPLDDLVPFAERDGELFIRGVQEIPKPEKPAKKSAAESKAAESVDDENWGIEGVEALKGHGLPAKKCEAIATALKAHGKPLARVRDLRDWMTENEWWHRDVKGLGPTWVDRVSDAMTDYYAANPIEESMDDDGDGTIFDGEEEDD